MSWSKDIFGIDIFAPDSYIVVGPNAAERGRAPRQVAKKADFHMSGDPYRGVVAYFSPNTTITIQIAPGKWLRQDWIACSWPDGRVRRIDGEIEQGDVAYLQRAGLL